MKYYKTYMDRQEIPPDRHEKLMNLKVEHKSPRRAWARYGALAACAALVLGVGLWKGLGLKAPSSSSVDSPELASGAIKSEEDTRLPEGEGCDDAPSFVVHSGVPEGPMSFFAMPGISFPDVSYSPEASASRAFAPPGTFTVDLTLEDVQKLFWGPEGIPETYDTEIGRQDLPWALFWDGYTLNGSAWYDGEGNFTELTLYGQKDRASFTLELRLGALPFTCLVEPDRTTTEYNGLEITGWSRSYDCDGDGQTDYICGSEFMLGNNIGVRFENHNCGDPEATDRLDAEAWFNTLFVREAVTGGLSLDHLMYNGNIPAWREATFDTLEQARQEADFAPYLPTAEPEGWSGYTGSNEDFFGRLSYQEGQQNMLFVRWSWEYNNVEVDVYFPEGDSTSWYEPVDINVPESYDTRLYGSAWYEDVPEEYRTNFHDVTFRAEDLSLETVMAREAARDTGGVGFHFNVLHGNGVVVSYYCHGITARQLWDMIEPTLP